MVVWWMSGSCLAVVWCLFGGCLAVVWWLSAGCLVGVLWVSGRCLEGIYRKSKGFGGRLDVPEEEVRIGQVKTSQVRTG